MKTVLCPFKTAIVTLVPAQSRYPRLIIFQIISLGFLIVFIATLLLSSWFPIIISSQSESSLYTSYTTEHQLQCTQTFMYLLERPVFEVVHFSVPAICRMYSL